MLPKLLKTIVISGAVFVGCLLFNDPGHGNSDDRVRLKPRTSDPCIVYTYDASGNRQTQTITVSGGGLTPSWGTGTWGCFTWTHQ